MTCWVVSFAIVFVPTPISTTTDDTDNLRGTNQAWTQDGAKLGELAKIYVDEGFTGLKFDPVPLVKHRASKPFELRQYELGNAERVVAEVREAIGEKADILIGTPWSDNPSRCDSSGQTVGALRSAMAGRTMSARELRRNGAYRTDDDHSYFYWRAISDGV